MNEYRRGAVLGLTIAETFIILTFLLLIAMLGLIQRDEPLPEDSTPNSPQVWIPPEEIEALVNAAKDAREAAEEAEQARVAAEGERDQAHKEAEDARKAAEKAEQARVAAEGERDQAREEAEDAREAAEKAEQAPVAAEGERDQAREEAEDAREAAEKAEQARADAEGERDQAHEEAEDAREAAEKAEQARADAEGERDQAQRNLAKGQHPPCWYQVVSANEGKTREKPYYVFDVAIREHSIELAPRTAPPGGAFDDGGEPYADEWKWLDIEGLPYGKSLSDNEFTQVVSDLVKKGRDRQVRTYDCVFSVMVWDMTPDHAKKRWKDAHDHLIEGVFGAYTVQDLEWKGVE